MSGYIHRGAVYFAVAGDYVKIGYCSRSDVNQRLGGLFSKGLIRPDDLNTSWPPRLLHTIPGCIQRDERRIHGLFARHHVIGEWFRLTPAFLLHLAARDYVTDAEVLRHFRDARRQLKQSRTAYLRAAA